MRLRHVLMTCALSSLTMPAVAADAKRTTAVAPAAEDADALAAARRFVEQVNIPYTSFILPNGLRVLVHTDHSAPIINISVWYDVASKDEPQGRSGFAHLFEHLMFNGSENVPGDYMKPLMAVGGEVNGSTSRDRTNYYETVPTEALDLALFMESDRMGHLLGAVRQDVLDEQRGVVQNEKRNGDNSATSIADYKIRKALYPANHPYGHSVIGSMKDLKAADLNDVRQWFKQHYGPNNALLILAGDIDPARAREAVTRYFGDIPAGPRNAMLDAGPVPLSKTIRETVTAPVTAPIIYRVWPVPGARDRDGVVLDAVMEGWGGASDDVLTRHLVREKKLFQSVSVNNSTGAYAGEFTVRGTVRPGVDPAVAAAALDQEIASFLQGTVSADDLTRFVTRFTYRYGRSLEDVATRGSTLGENAMAHGDPDAYKKNLRIYAQQTPASTMAAARRWLTRPRYELTVLPGPRVTPEDDAGIDGSGTQPPTPAPAASTAAPRAEPQQGSTGRRMPAPPVTAPADARFPLVEHAQLSNGISVSYVPSKAVPFTFMTLSIDGGSAAEPVDRAGTMEMMYDMLGKGYGKLTEEEINRKRELFGISIGAGAGFERGSITMDAPDANLARGLDMVRLMLEAPSFPEDKLERLKREKLDGMARSRLEPSALTQEVLDPLISPGSPRNGPTTAESEAATRRIDRAALLADFQRWVRPEHASIDLVSDKPLAALLPELERAIGTWQPAGKPLPVPPITYSFRPTKPEIVLIDLPGAVQATVQGAQAVPADDRDPQEPVWMADKVLGSDFTSRINMNLREDKQWTYGAYSGFTIRDYGSKYSFNGEIQQDKVGAAIAEVMKEMRDVLGSRPISDAEFATAKKAMLAQAPRSFANRFGLAAVLSDLRENNRSDDYPGHLSDRLRATTAATANATLHAQLDPDRWVWAIVGNAAIIRPQLDKLGLPVRVLKAEDVLPPIK